MTADQPIDDLHPAADAEPRAAEEKSAGSKATGERTPAKTAAVTSAGTDAMPEKLTGSESPAEPGPAKPAVADSADEPGAAAEPVSVGIPSSELPVGADEPAVVGAESAGEPWAGAEPAPAETAKAEPVADEEPSVSAEPQPAGEAAPDPAVERAGVAGEAEAVVASASRLDVPAGAGSPAASPMDSGQADAESVGGECAGDVLAGGDLAAAESVGGERAGDVLAGGDLAAAESAGGEHVAGESGNELGGEEASVEEGFPGQDLAEDDGEEAEEEARPDGLDKRTDVYHWILVPVATLLLGPAVAASIMLFVAESAKDYPKICAAVRSTIDCEGIILRMMTGHVIAFLAGWLILWAVPWWRGLRPYRVGLAVATALVLVAIPLRLIGTIHLGDSV